MGSPLEELEHQDDESPRHIVTVQPFFIGKYRYPILWDGHPARLDTISRLFMPAPQEILGYFFIWKSLIPNF
ncbi:hypothetical protein MEO40_14365 [Dolichospermum sp. ST_sed1]|nr:hypothetical protein [Dolichospermum sp. ST_sed1]